MLQFGRLTQIFTSLKNYTKAAVKQNAVCSPATLYITTTLLVETYVSFRIQKNKQLSFVHFHSVYTVYQESLYKPFLFISITHRLIFTNMEVLLKTIIRSYHLKYIFAL